MNHIAAFLRDICLDKKTGRLDFKFGEIQKYLFLQNGNLIFARTNIGSEKIGEILFRLGFLSEEVHSKIEQYIEPRQNIGKVLVGLGIISEQDLQEGLTAQMKEITLSLFSYFEGEIDFKEQERFVDQAMQSRVGIPFIIEEGIRRMRFHPELKRFLEGKIPAFKAKVHQHLLADEEKKILNAIDGRSKAAHLALLSGMSPEDFWKSLYLVYCLGIINLGEDEADLGRAPAEEVSAESFQAQLRDVLSWRDRASTQNYYQLFRVSRDASDEDIKRAYFQLARRCHPDRFGRSLPADIKKQVDDVFDLVTKAYRTLTDRSRRQEYDQSLGASPQEEAVNLARKADIKFRQGKTLYNQGRFEESIILLEQAVRLGGQKGDYFLLLGMAESRVAAFRKKAEQDFLKAIELEPWNPEGLVGLGMLYKQEGLVVKARRQFERAIGIDPDHEIALHELDMAVGPKKRGLFSLFGSKKK